MLFGAMTMGSVSAQGTPTVIRIGTQNTDLILQVADNGRLYQSYFGEHLLHDADINQFSWNVLSSSDGSMSDRGWEVYSCNGNEDYFEPALSVIHNDGNRTTYLYYQNHKQTKVATSSSAGARSVIRKRSLSPCSLMPQRCFISIIRLII